MEIKAAKAVLSLARVWRVPCRHRDVPNACIKAEKEEDLEFFLHVLQDVKRMN